jgi:putative transposase
MSAHCDEELAANAFHMALARRRPKAGLLHHSDRGCQYTSRAYRLLLEQSGMIVSMSRKGNGWDNATMESFFGTLKEECVGSTIYQSHEEARLALLSRAIDRTLRSRMKGELSCPVLEPRWRK